MTDKRFVDDGVEEIENQSLTDNLTGRTYWIDNGLDEIIKLLNELAEENQGLKNDCGILVQSNQDYRKENKQLKQEMGDLGTAHAEELNKIEDEFDDEILKLEKENEQLQERNDRQAKRLDNLYHLIEKEDWKTLKGIIQEFQECEEQLQKEWGTYGDVE